MVFGTDCKYLDNVFVFSEETVPDDALLLDKCTIKAEPPLDLRREIQASLSKCFWHSLLLIFFNISYEFYIFF
jgi:hypothetical protein